MTADAFAAVLDDIRKDEGLVLTPYMDTEGVLTIGYGINLRDGLSRAECEMLLEHRAVERLGDLTSVLPWFNAIDPVRQRVLLNMAYQLGVHGLLEFRKMLDALKAENYEKAATEMEHSLWARQTPHRVARLAAMMRTGQA